jgi:integrase
MGTLRDMANAPKKQRRESGSLRERPAGSGRWQLRAWDAVIQQPRTKTVEAKNRRAAQALLAGFVREVQLTRGMANGKETLRDAFEVWMNVDDKEESALVRAGYSMKHVEGILDVPVSAITRELLEDLYKKLQAHGGRCSCADREKVNHRRPVCPKGRPLAKSTVQRTHNDVRAALEEATERHWVSANPAEKAGPKKVQRPKIVQPSDDEVAALLGAAEKDWMTFVCLNLAALCGLRRGELCGLRWTHVNFDSSQLVVERAVAHGRSGLVVKGPKNNEARTLAIDEDSVRLLRSHYRWWLERAMEAGVRIGPGAYLFSNSVDGAEPWRPDGVTSRFKRIRARAGLPGVRLHDLRHYMCTVLGAAGVDWSTLSARSGHKDLRTLQIYTHALSEQDRRAAEIMRLHSRRPQRPAQGE